MAIDLELMKRKLENSKNNKSGNKKDSPFFKPTEGDQTVRFLPSDDKDPFKEYYIHYNLGEPFLCPKRNFNQKCAVCDFAWSLYSTKVEADMKAAKKYWPQQRFFTNVVCRNKETEGVKPYGYGKKTYEQLLKLTIDPDYGDITDPEKGYDFLLNYQKPEKEGAFPQTTLTIRPKTSALAKTKKEITEIMEKAAPIEKFMNKKSSEEVLKILKENTKEPWDEPKDEETRGGGKATEELGIDSLDAAIEEMESQD